MKSLIHLFPLDVSHAFHLGHLPPFPPIYPTLTPVLFLRHISDLVTLLLIRHQWLTSTSNNRFSIPFNLIYDPLWSFSTIFSGFHPTTNYLSILCSLSPDTTNALPILCSGFTFLLLFPGIPLPFPFSPPESLLMFLHHFKYFFLPRLS